MHLRAFAGVLGRLLDRSVFESLSTKNDTPDMKYG